VSSLSTAGHVHPLLPLALALQQRGHEVLYAVHAEYHAAIERRGLETAAAGLSSGDRRARLGEVVDLQTLPPRELPDFMFPYGFGAIAMPVMAADLRTIAASWPPDLMIHDAAELAAPLVAAQLGIRHATHSFGTTVPLPRVAKAGDLTAELWTEAGLTQPPYAGLFDDLYVDIRPPSLPGHPPHGTEVLQERPVSLDTVGGAAPPIVTTDDGRPLVYVTFGTIFNDRRVLALVVDAIAGLDLRALVTTGKPETAASFERLPDNITVTSYVPQHLVLPHCDLVVSHAGSGTFLAALSAGLPQLCLPQGADQFLNADAAAEVGAAIAIEPEVLTGDAVRSAIAELLRSPSYRQVAETIAAEIAQMPSADDVAAQLEQVAGARR
jgi:UDP:flavonoid glycosyltransferase YjiC (YdhE family)